jgi:uncharacterized membrane protein YdbT with pleckstrin-like domain
MENHQRHALGTRAFFLFLLKRMKAIVFMFTITWGIWYCQRFIPESFHLWTDYAVRLLFALSCALFVYIITMTYLEYHYYTYTFTEEAFLMTYGYLVRNEIAALYHQIQNVNIRRGISDRLIGVSQLVIVMTGLEKDGQRSQITLPAVGRTKARLVQKELLVRARRHFAGTNHEEIEEI